MLDPQLFDQLAAQPEKNAPAVNVALAEEGHAAVLLLLARSHATGSDAVTAIAQRIQFEGEALEQAARAAMAEQERAYEPVLPQLDQALIVHPNASDEVRDALLSRHAQEPFYVLAASAHPRATLLAAEHAALWPSRFPTHDRLWIQLLPLHALGPLTVEAWAQDPNPLKREVVARLATEPGHLAAFQHDPARSVRRALASNPNAAALRIQLAAADPAVEVRARAAGPIGEHGSHAGVPLGSARFAAALRSMESGGVLAPDVAAALSGPIASLDEEGALLAARVLPHQPLVALIEGVHDGVAPASERGLAAGLALRSNGDGDGELREIIADAAKALTHVAARYGNLTGKARLAAWLGDGLRACEALDRPRLVPALCRGVIGAEGPVLARACDDASLSHWCNAATAEGRGDALPAALLELAWRNPVVSDATVLQLAKRIAKAKPRGKELADDELDLDPTRRSLEVLEQVVLQISRKVPFTPRTALAVVALDSRRVRYVLTALPQWRGRLSGGQLARVLRQHAGALSAGRSEARPRAATIKGWTERMLTDAELAVALGIGHITPAMVAQRLTVKRYNVEDGVSLAHGADCRAALAGAESIKPMLQWARQNRTREATALALWLLLEHHDRRRPTGMLSSAIDSLTGGAVAACLTEALATLERREPGRLEHLTPQTPRGRATLATAIARAYRAIGGLRDER